MYLTMDGRPWLPVMGEFHYSRVPESEWEEELLKMKSSGVQIVSTYVIWIHHEEVRGEFDWSGQKNLRHFAELCRKHGLYLVVRIGPWTHGEVRNGGLPDWLLKLGPTRRNDPGFMAQVAALYTQIGSQLKGLLWKDGGPVIGIQLENEYSARGPSQGEEYILALKRQAIKSGLDVPLYTVTGWDNAVVPKGEVLPVFGGYPDAPWDSSIASLPPNEVYLFRFRSRIAGDRGNGTDGAKQSNSPFLTAELGGGVQDTYHRRPVIEPDDVAAMAPVMIGSGANLYGYYMFQGGQNPDGRLTTLQESQETGYPTDVPTKSYDFQAPLSEFGQERASFRKLKVFHYFLNEFGSDLARMSVHQPFRTPKSADDTSVVRASVRSDGQHGYLFVNNYIRGRSMPARKGTQFHVLLPHSELRIPEKPIEMPSGAYFIWPFNLDLGNATLEYATAQLFTRIKTRDGETFFFEEQPGISAEFVLKNDSGLTVQADGAIVEARGKGISISNIPTGFDHGIHLRRGNGPEVRLVLLSRRDAENTWRLSLNGHTHLLETDKDFFAAIDYFVLQSEGDPHCAFALFPPFSGLLKVDGGKLTERSQSYFSASVPESHPVLEVKKIQEVKAAPAVKLGPPFSWRPKGVGMAPQDADFKAAGKWAITVPRHDQSSTVSNLFLHIDYAGDVARLSFNGNLLDDNFNNGLPWVIGLRRFNAKIQSGPLELSILPLRRDAPIFLERRFLPSFGDGDQLGELKGTHLTVQYQFKFEISAK